MPNLLQTATNWTDANGASPPAEWDGTAYVFAAVDTLTLNAAAAEGDTLQATFTGTQQGQRHQIAINVNGVDVIPWGSIWDSFPDSIDITLAAGDAVEIVLSTDLCGYAPDFTMTPPALPPVTNYNCDCDDEHPTETLVNLRKYLMVRLGFAAMLASPPPGMTDLLNSFLVEAQNLLYQRFRMLRLERWFTWDMTAGTRFYDLGANADTCTKKLDATRVRYVGISQGDNNWRPLVCGIDPLRYSYQGASIPDSYEIRQCIEVFPAPADDSWKLRIKGDFGLLPFAADTDVTTIDPQAIKLHALAYAKAHYGQPDAANHMSALTTFLGDLTASTHQTRRYIPGERLAPPAIPPKVAG